MPTKTKSNVPTIDKIKAFELFEREWQKNSDGQSLQSEFMKIHHMGWCAFNNDALFNEDLEILSNFQLYLISRVNEILIDERSIKNQAFVRSNTKLDELFIKTDEGKSGDGILFFHNQCTHFLFGDLHSDDESLENGLLKANFYDRIINKDEFKLIFLGDYVDRGYQHLKILEHLLMLKILFPENIYLLRGNHDGGILQENGQILLPYGLPPTDDPKLYFPLYLKALISENETCSPQLLPAYLHFFDQLPYIAFIKKKHRFIQCVHGGIPRPIEKDFSHLKTLSDLTQFRSGQDHILQNIMWSDPYKGTGDMKNGMKRFYFTQEAFEAYCERFGVSTLFRGHEVVEEGVLAHFNENLFTIFSSGTTEATYYKEVTPKIVKIDSEGKFYFL